MYTSLAASDHDLPAAVPLDILFKKGGSQPPGGTLHQWSSLIGIITAIVGNLLISFALNTQRYAHILIDREYSQSRKVSANGHSIQDQARGYGSNQHEAITE